MAAMYLKIKKDLLEKINTGVYKEGSLIPTEMELSKFYNVSRPTVRQAVQLLVDDGYLEKRRKRGTMVCQRKTEQEFTQKILNFDTEMNEKDLNIVTKVISLKTEKASEEVAEALGINLADKVFKLIRLKYIDSKPNVIITTYIPYKQFTDIKKLDFDNSNLYDYFSKKGNPITKIKRKLETVKADETTADLLNIQLNDPIFYFHSYGYDRDKHVVDYSISKYRGDINYFVFDLYR